MMRQVASLGLRQVLRASGQSSISRVVGPSRLVPNNSSFVSFMGYSSKSNSEQEPLEVPTNIEKSDAAHKAVFHLHQGQDVHPTYQSNPPMQLGGQGLASDSTYDCNKTVSLHSVMQSNVPHPFSAPGKAPSHLNMPGTQEGQQNKYIAQEVQQLHSNNPEEKAETAELSKKDRLKKAVKEYGATLIVFHVTMSLASLGVCYTAVSSGFDLTALVQKIGFEISTPSIASAGTFVVAYAVHKVFAPVRISITLAAVPFLVKYFRMRRKVK